MSRGSIGILVAALALAGCGERGVPEARTSSGEQACMDAAARQAGNADVELMSSAPSEAGSYVTVGVGAARAPWQCLVVDGRVQQLQSLGEGGAL